MADMKVEPPRYNPNRPNDYVYDPLFTVSSQKDYQKAMMDAAVRSAEFRIRPNFFAMFSELVQYPNAKLALIEGSDRIPPFVDKSWDAHKRDQGMIQKAIDVNGTYRFRFCGRPIVPYKVVEPLYFVSVDSRQLAVEKKEDKPPSTKLKNRGTQTKYRESSAQTIPWEPPYKVVGDTEPEVLTLAFLSWGYGLPAGMHECKIIERARIRRAWERSLPPVTDEASLDLRRQVISQIETDEWAFREREIDDIQYLRLELMLKMMEKTFCKLSERAMKKLQNFWLMKQSENEKKISKIKHDTTRAIRKLDMKHKGIKMKYEYTNIVEEHIKFDSELYGPMKRHGEHPKRYHQVIPPNNEHTPQYLGVENLSTLPRWLQNYKEPMKRFPEKKSEHRHLCLRETKWNKANLAKLHRELKLLRLSYYNKPKPLSLRVRKMRIELPPDTPRVDVINDRDEETHQAALLIQKIVRGRAIQSLIYEGRDRNRELIEELKSTHALQEADMLLRNAERIDIMMQQRNRQIQIRNAEKVDEILKYLEGTTFGTALDYLNKELLRLQEERRAHAFALMALRERWRRESQEAGRRQQEERRRREHDEIFKQIVKVQQETVDIYLEDIILEGIENRADKEARNYVKKLADVIQKTAEEATSNDFLEREEITADLIHNFVLPEVEKQMVRTKLRKKQEKYLLTAHKAIYDEIPKLPKVPLTEQLGEPETEHFSDFQLNDIDLLKLELLEDLQFSLDRAISAIAYGSERGEDMGETTEYEGITNTEKDEVSEAVENETETID